MWGPPQPYGYPPGGYGAPPPDPYAAGGYGAPPPGAYGAPPAPYGAPPPGAYGAPPDPYAAGGYGAPPPTDARYGAPPPSAAPYGAPPSPYGAPPPAGYGAPPAAAGYGAPPPAAGYGAPPYGAPPPGAYGAPPPAAGYGAPPYGAPPPGAAAPYGAPPPSAAAAPYGAPPAGVPYGAAAASPYNTADTQVWPRPARIATGNRKALLIGINYIGHARGQLRGCINDVRNIYNFLTRGAGFNPSNVRVLTDDQSDPSCRPTRQNIEEAMRWLVAGVAPGDSLVFHFSGHGGQAKDPTFLEDDGMNETILPMDYETAGQIIDDKIHALLAKPIPAGARLTAIFDSCHSGTAMDLPFLFKSKSSKYKSAHRNDQDTLANRHKKFSITKGITSQIASHIGGEVAYHIKKQARKKINESINETKGEVIQISGCRDEQTSADATMGGEATGAMSFSLLEALRRNPNVSYEQLIDNMREILHTGPKQYRQVPQLSYGNPSMDMAQLFTL